MKKNLYFLLAFCFLLQLESLASDPKICLTMIVKNESRIIERCLNSVKDLVDCVSICDTGSTDNTVALIEEFLKTHHIPGKVHRQPWKNFGHNRTQSALAAQELLRELNFPLDETYLLLLDADMILRVQPNFERHALQNDAYLLLQKSHWGSYYNTRLILASLPWECIGPTHEFWSCKQSFATQERLDTLMIDDYEDGGCKSDKFERDVKLLSEGLREQPNNSRYMFYLAQSYKCLKQYDQAIHWYKNRIAQNGWNEEVWYSKYMIGECYQEMGYWDQALCWYLDAYQYLPRRAEPLQKIANYYRLNGKNDLAYLYAKQGAQIPLPSDLMLFISNPVYDYLLDEELSIAAYYTPHKEEGFTALNRLLLKKQVPKSVKETAYQNLLFYVGNLKNAQFKPIDITPPLLAEGSTEHYSPTNSSIRKELDGYRLICRTVNYQLLNGKDFVSRDQDGKIRTRNYLVDCDASFNITSQKEIKENLPRIRIPSRIQGLEDCRLVNFHDRDYFIAATYDIAEGTIAQSLSQLSKEGSDVETLVQLKGHLNKNCEKNWLPFVADNKLLAIYSYDPLIFYHLDPETGACSIVKDQETSHDFSHFRGSSGPVPFNEGLLALVHEVIFKEGRRYYLHRFIYLDKDYTIAKVSKPFTFLHTGVEYCCGMTLDHAGKHCILTISNEERESFFCSVDVDTVEALLEPLPK